MSGKRLDARRVYSALVFLPLFYLLVRYGSPIVFFALVLAATLLAMAEFYRLHFRTGPVSVEIVSGFGCAGLLLSSLQWPEILPPGSVLALGIMLVLTSRLFAREPMKHSLIDVGIILLGIVYVALMLGHLILTRAREGGEWLILYLFVVTWAADTGAYYAGTAFGKHKLAPLISPNKTVEGLFGGVALSVLAALIAKHWFMASFSTIDCLALGLLLSLTGVLGDLAESALKRSAGVKDSGSLIPGHGGVLDRLDSLLFTAPAFYYYLIFVKA